MFVPMFVAAMAMQAATADRSAYVSCLKDAVFSAKAANVGIDGFKAYAHETCASVEDGFKSKLVSFNVKNGMSKKTASEDAQLQLEDYVFSAEDKYRYSVEEPK
ncbi:MAG: hypothetical protein H0W39_02315 [Sphingomonas sp.]|nr:hypothetical protein [Sphingomonas sp.]